MRVPDTQRFLEFYEIELPAKHRPSLNEAKTQFSKKADPFASVKRESLVYEGSLQEHPRNGNLCHGTTKCK